MTSNVLWSSQLPLFIINSSQLFGFNRVAEKLKWYERAASVLGNQMAWSPGLSCGPVQSY
jgi:hypothetical protein